MATVDDQAIRLVNPFDQQPPGPMDLPGRPAVGGVYEADSGYPADIGEAPQAPIDSGVYPPGFFTSTASSGVQQAAPSAPVPPPASPSATSTALVQAPAAAGSATPTQAAPATATGLPEWVELFGMIALAYYGYQWAKEHKWF